MDLDAFVGQHQPQWRRLEELLRRRRPTAAEADELLDLYQRVSTHLSVVQSANPDPSVTRYLSALLTRARVLSTSRRTTSVAALGTFVTRTFPAALYDLRRWWVATLVVNVVVGFALAAWTMRHPELYGKVLTPAEVDRLVGTDFQGYYSAYAHHELATQVWVNNAWVAARCIALGVLGLPVIALLWSNLVNVSVQGALMASHGRAGLFWGLILPHGMLELTAVFVAAATGLHLFWTWVDPGPLPRLRALGVAGRQAMAVALGLVGVLLVSGVIEGFVTPSDLPTAARILIGCLAEGAFLTYVFTLGRWAHAAGVIGDIDRRSLGEDAPVAA